MDLLVGGCSFSSDNNGWQNYLTKKYRNIINTAYPAAGNTYISNCIQDHCLYKKYDMVLVMWSGYSRLDLPTPWRHRHADNNYEWCISSQHSKMPVEWLLSGGYNAGWRSPNSPEVYDIFQKLYREMDFAQLAYLTLKNILNTQQYLVAKQQPYYFMTFINYWDRNRPEQQFKSFYYDDPPIDSWPQFQYLIDQIDWSRWIFDNGKNGIYERCIDVADLAPDRLHVGEKINQDWGNKVLSILER